MSELYLYEDDRIALIRALATAAYTFEERHGPGEADKMWELHSELTDITDECRKDKPLTITVGEHDEY